MRKSYKNYWKLLKGTVSIMSIPLGEEREKGEEILFKK